MKRRSHLLFASVSVLTACAIGAACTFPDVEFAPPGAGAGETSTGTDGGGGDDASTDSSASADAAIIEAATRTDADTKTDAAGCSSCDCDQDGFFRRGGGCDGGPGAVYDCDDDDKLIKPSQGFVDDFQWSSGHPIAYDWNCDGHVDRAYATNLKCGGTVLTGCTGGQGFQGNGPGCGSPGDYFECKAVNGFCAAAKIDTRNQTCK